MANTTLPRFVKIDGDPDSLGRIILGPGMVVDRETKLGYGFGEDTIDLAVASLNAGEVAIEDYLGEPLTETEAKQYAAATSEVVE